MELNEFTFTLTKLGYQFIRDISYIGRLKIYVLPNSPRVRITHSDKEYDHYCIDLFLDTICEVDVIDSIKVLKVRLKSSSYERIVRFYQDGEMEIIRI